MYVIGAVNVNDAYRQGMRYLSIFGQRRESRNGPVLRARVPVTTVYGHPRQRLLFDAQRDANPFFHLFEALWILDGRNDLWTLEHFLPQFKAFSDDGLTLHGAYGHRLRRHFTQGHEGLWLDQLEWAAQRLKNNPDDRRVVLQIWDPNLDPLAESADIPCNDTIKLCIVDNALDMYVFNRSNDIIWGCYGANAVHFSMVQEYVAAMIGVDVGVYEQISTDFHAYVEQPYKWEKYWPLNDTPFDEARQSTWVNPYLRMEMYIHPLVDDPRTFDDELKDCMNWLNLGVLHAQEFDTYTNTFFRDIVLPMYRAFRIYKDHKDPQAAYELLTEIVEQRLSRGEMSADWIHAGRRWLQRRVKP